LKVHVRIRQSPYLRLAHAVVGTPKWVIEILSPGSWRVDRIKKLNLYQRAGVSEYWIIDPIHQGVETFVLQDGSYGEPQTYARGDMIQVSVFKDWESYLNRVFPDESEGVKQE
ncbi:MAG: Uma2 family endonuclease, partial [Alicyclobacillus herbarius]|uniref:Uma2 family endonuclease n=1 Tax=Alicyclobacillus herbarius TaxID=122960 RepID=UPI0023569749